MHGRGYGFFADILLGLIGAVIGNWIFGQLGVQASGGIGFIAMAVVGAVIIKLQRYIDRKAAPWAVSAGPRQN